MSAQTIEHEGPTEVPKEEKKSLPTVVEDGSSFMNLMDTDRFAQMWRVATMFAKSEMVPEDFRGKPENCMIIVEQAMRLDLAPFMMLQNTYIVHGKPGMSAQLVIALVNKNGPFEGPIQFELSGEGDARQCRAFATHKTTDQICQQIVTIGMAKAEGWYEKRGSKWQTIPDLMLQYRSAAWLGRVFAPECLMGMQTHEELLDVDPAPPHVGYRRAKDVTPLRAVETPPPAEAAEPPVEAAEAPTEAADKPEEKPADDRKTIREMIKEIEDKIDAFTDLDDLNVWVEIAGPKFDWVTGQDKTAGEELDARVMDKINLLKGDPE